MQCPKSPYPNTWFNFGGKIKMAHLKEEKSNCGGTNVDQIGNLISFLNLATRKTYLHMLFNFLN